MLILVTLMFFDQEAGLDAPAISCAKIAALMDIVVIEGATGNPGMPSGFGNDLSFITNFLPTLFADHNVEVHVVALSRLEIFVFNVIDPGEVLPTITPDMIELVFRQ